MTALAAGWVALLLLVGTVASGVLLDVLLSSIQRACPSCRFVVTSPSEHFATRAAMAGLLVAPAFVAWLALAGVRLATAGLPSWRGVLVALGAPVGFAALDLAWGAWRLTSAFGDIDPGGLQPTLLVRELGPDASSFVMVSLVALVVPVVVARIERRRTGP